MSFIPAFLSIFNFQVKDSSFDGNKPVGKGCFKGGNGDVLDISFKRPVNINLITLFEKGENVTDFEIYTEKNGTFEMIYKQNRISKFRVCAIEATKTQKIRIKILDTRKGRFNEIKAFVYNLPKKKIDFRRTAYVVTDKYKDIDRDNLKYYNKFNLISGVNMDENGSVTVTDSFIGALEMLRIHDPNADVVATLFPSGDYLKTFKNPETSQNIKKFIDEYNLNGVSFDWEYPKNYFEWRVFDKFLVKLKETIGEKTITLALASWLRYHFSEKALKSIDVAEVMTYDNMARDIDGYHSEFFSDGPNAIYHFVKKGFSLSQLNLGLPYYARPVDGTGYWKDYKAEVDKMDKFTNVVHGDYEDLDWKNKKIIVKSRFYNSCQMVEDKTTFCIYANVGGVMVWHIGTDAPESHELCLSKTLNKTVNCRIG